MVRKKDSPLNVMLVDDQPGRSAMVEKVLSEKGLNVISAIPSCSGLLFQMEQHQPDIILIDLDSPDRDILESLAIINTHNPRPVVMFSREDDPDFISRAVQSGVTAYQLDSVNPDKVKPVIDLAMAQFNAYQSLRKELDSTKTQLADRKIIERAKGLLMKTQKIDEEEAYATLRSLAMETNQRLATAAQSVISMLEKNIQRQSTK